MLASLRDWSLLKPCVSPRFISFVMQQLYSVGAKAGIQPFEYVRGVHLETKQFTLENGLLTGDAPSSLLTSKGFFDECADRERR